MWPKVIKVRGLELEVSDWDEVDEVMKRYGNESAELIVRDPSLSFTPPKSKPQCSLDAGDQTLLRRFVEENSLPTKDIGRALGRSGKAIRRGMIEWSQKIGLTTDSRAFAFQSCFRGDGRGYKLIDHFREVGRQILNGNR